MADNSTYNSSFFIDMEKFSYQYFPGIVSYRGVGSYAFENIINSKNIIPPRLEDIPATGEFWSSLDPHPVYNPGAFSLRDHWMALMYAFKETYWDRREPEIFEALLNLSFPSNIEDQRIENVKKFFRKRRFNFPGIPKCRKRLRGIKTELNKLYRNNAPEIHIFRMEFRKRMYGQILKKFGGFSPQYLDQLHKELESQYPVLLVLDNSKFSSVYHRLPDFMEQGRELEYSSKFIPIEAIICIYVPEIFMDHVVKVSASIENVIYKPLESFFKEVLKSNFDESQTLDRIYNETYG